MPIPSIPSYISVISVRSNGRRSAIVMVLILEEEVLVDAVDGESDRGSAKAGKSALEALFTGEFAVDTPGLAVSRVGYRSFLPKEYSFGNSLPFPRIVVGHAGSSTVLSDIEPRGVGLGEGGAENS